MNLEEQFRQRIFLLMGMKCIQPLRFILDSIPLWHIGQKFLIEKDIISQGK